MYATVDNPEDKTNYTAAYTKSEYRFGRSCDFGNHSGYRHRIGRSYQDFRVGGLPGNGKTFDYTFMIENPSFETVCGRVVTFGPLPAVGMPA